MASKLSNPVHYGYGFIQNGDTNLQESASWTPKPLSQLANENILPTLRLPENAKFVKSDSDNFKKLKCDTTLNVSQHKKGPERRQDLIKIVQKWVQSREIDLLRSDSSQTVVPIICCDKAIRYARTLEQYFNFKSKRGYAIKVKLLPSAPGCGSGSGAGDNNGPVKYYSWSVVESSSPPTNEGIMFEYYMFKDFYNTAEKHGGDKSFQFFSVTSFDWIRGKIVYRFFCIGEIDGVEKVGEGNYLPLEIKSSSASEESFSRYKLAQYYAKCAVSQIQKLIVGMRSTSNEDDEDKRRIPVKSKSSAPIKITYKEIREYGLSDFPGNVNAKQEENLEKALEVFHNHLVKIKAQEPSNTFLNGYAGYVLDVSFENYPRKC